MVNIYFGVLRTPAVMPEVTDFATVYTDTESTKRSLRVESIKIANQRAAFSSIVSVALLVAVRVGADESLHGGVCDEGGAVAREAVAAERVAARRQHLEILAVNVAA